MGSIIGTYQLIYFTFQEVTLGVLAYQKKKKIKVIVAVLVGTLEWKCSFIKKRNVISTLECKFLRHKGFLTVF